MRSFARFWRHVGALRLSIALSVASAALFAVPDQMHEVYRALAQGWVTDPVKVRLALVAAAAALVVLGIAVWLVGRMASGRHAVRVPAEAGSLALRSGPVLAAVLPLLGTAYGTLRARIDSGMDAAGVRSVLYDVFFAQWKQSGLSDDAAMLASGKLADELMAFNEALLTAALALGAAAVVLAAVLALIEWRLPRLTARFETARWGMFASVGLMVVLLAVTGAVVMMPVWAPQLLGTVAIAASLMILSALVLAMLSDWSEETGVPLVTLAVAVPLAIGALDLNDNHWIREASQVAAPLPKKERIEEAFGRWFRSRETLARYQGRRVPVYVVAAQGGGIYAATHAASFLAAIQDYCPGFSHHLFAVSGVSGGSVGATVFAALTKDFDWSKHDARLRLGCVDRTSVEYRTYFTDAVSEIFNDDLLAPLAAGLAFPDFVQRFIPYPITSFDRARYLEVALEEAYGNGTLRSNFLKAARPEPWGLAPPFTTLWNPEAFPSTPALALNATEVDTGRRRVVSPFTFEGTGLSFLPVWAAAEDTNQINLPLSTAAILSARFPWVTPAATFEDIDAETGKNRRYRLVDGGYFENSGVATALDIIAGIRLSAANLGLSDRIEINLLIFSSVDFSDPPRGYGLGELMEPLRAMLSTRAARATIEIEKAMQLPAVSTTSGDVAIRVVKLNLKGHGYRLPLGWTLSEITRHIISHQSSARPEACKTPPAKLASQGEISVACVTDLISDQIREN